MYSTVIIKDCIKVIIGPRIELRFQNSRYLDSNSTGRMQSDYGERISRFIKLSRMSCMS